MTAIASSDALNAIFIGGVMDGDDFVIGESTKLPIISRMDLDQQTWRWRKSFFADNRMMIVTSLSVNP